MSLQKTADTYYALHVSSWMRQKELSQLDKSCINGLTRLDDQKRQEMTTSLELFPFARYHPNE
jgi:hypothetical protein